MNAVASPFDLLWWSLQDPLGLLVAGLVAGGLAAYAWSAWPMSKGSRVEVPPGRVRPSPTWVVEWQRVPWGVEMSMRPAVGEGAAPLVSGVMGVAEWVEWRRTFESTRHVIFVENPVANV